MGPNNMGGKFQLVIGKALDDSGSGTLSGVLDAVQSCVDKGAKVISLSLGGGGYSQTTDEFYSNLYENDGILFVAAAGNGGSSSKMYPASYPALMSVAAIDSSKNKASFSQYNDQVEISAPGVSVKSSLPEDKYASWSGTSMATPHVAGVAGLLWMHFPECKNYQIRNVLAATAMHLGSTDGCDNQYGYGLVQAKDAYELLAEGNCGGNIGTNEPTGGCEQLYPGPNCEVDSDCNDKDICTADTCNNGQCVSTPQCASLCGKSKVDVEITIDNYGEETTYDIMDASGSTIMEGSGWPSNSVNSFWKCVASGTYSFKITDGYGDGLCCSNGNGGYSIKVNDQEVASGGDFDSEETKTFDVVSSAPVAPPTPAPETPPTPFPIPSQNPLPTKNPTKTCKSKGEPCEITQDCCEGSCEKKGKKRICKPTPICKSSGGSCKKDENCCSGLSCAKKSFKKKDKKKKICRKCQGFNQECSKGVDCCSLKCNIKLKKCINVSKNKKKKGKNVII